MNGYRPEYAASKKPSSFVTVHSFNEFVKEGLKLDPPKELILHVIVEYEMSILFGDTGCGKSTLALQFAIQMAEQGKEVLYMNFELSQLQLAKKFPEKEIPEKLKIANIDYMLMPNATSQSKILKEIEKQAIECKTEVLIVDNLTNLCINSKDGAEAGKLMQDLKELSVKNKWTMLILAHVPKRMASDPLTLNDLAGSKNISNFADNVIGINRSTLGTDKRYLIQLKYRSFPIELDERNVQELSLEMSDGYLHFDFRGFSAEYIHLPRSRDEKAELEQKIVKELRKPNRLSYRNIAANQGTSLGTVQRIAEKYDLCPDDDKSKK